MDFAGMPWGMKKTSGGVLAGIVLVFIASVTGVGFSSGQEVYRFFASYGAMGGISVLILPFICTFLAFAFLYTAKKRNTDAYENVMAAFDCKPLKWLSDALISFFVASVVIAMIAAFGTILRQLFGLNTAVGSLLGALFILISMLAGSADTIARFLRVAVPVVAVCACLCCIASFFLPPGSGGPIAPRDTFPGGWLVSGLLFCCYNMLVVVSVLAPSAGKLQKKRHMILCAALPSLVFALLAGLEYLAIVRHIPAGTGGELPMPRIGGLFSPVVFYLYQLLMLVSAYGTALSCFSGTLSRIYRIKFLLKFRRRAVILALSAIFWIASFLGFVNIVSYVYPVIGGLGALLMLSLSVSFFKCLYDELHKTKKTRNN